MAPLFLNVLNLENALVTTEEGTAWESRLADVALVQQTLVAGATNAENTVAALEGCTSSAGTGRRGVNPEQLAAQVADVAEAGGGWAPRDATYQVPNRGSRTTQQEEWSWDSASWYGSSRGAGSRASASEAGQADPWAAYANETREREAAADAWAGWRSGNWNH